jgi:hypothetical protein
MRRRRILMPAGISSELDGFARAEELAAEDAEQKA